MKFELEMAEAGCVQLRQPLPELNGAFYDSLPGNCLLRRGLMDGRVLQPIGKTND